MSEHTKEPWRLWKIDHDQYGIEHYNPEAQCYVQIGSGSFDYATANMIVTLKAKRDELLAVMREIAEYKCPYIITSKARAAIANAEKS